MGKPRSVTDYSAGLYGEQLPLSSATGTRHSLEVSPLACKDWGATVCTRCPIQDWAGPRTPWCGAAECPTCDDRQRCCCGNEELRERLWRCIRLWQQDRLRTKLGKEVPMTVASSLHV